MISVEFNGGSVIKSFVLIEFLEERLREISTASPRTATRITGQLERNADLIMDRWQQAAKFGIGPDLVDISDLEQELKTLFAKYVCQQKLQ